MIGVLHQLDSKENIAVFLKNSRLWITTTSSSVVGMEKLKKQVESLENISHFTLSNNFLSLSVQKTLWLWGLESFNLKLTLEVEDEIQTFQVSKKLILVSLGLKILGFDSNGQTRFWTVAGGIPTSFLGLDGKYFMVGGQDCAVRFYQRDLVVGELCLTQVPQWLIGIKGWKFLVVTRDYLGIYEKNLRVWTKKFTNITLSRYFKGLIYLGQDGNRLVILKEENGDLVDSVKFSKEILDVFCTRESKILVLFGDEEILEITSDIKLSERAAKNLQNASDPARDDTIRKSLGEDDTIRKSLGEDDTIRKSLGEGVAVKLDPLKRELESRVVLKERIILTRDYKVILELTFNLMVRKILVESTILLEPCFIIDQGTEFQIPLNLIWNRQGEILLTALYDFYKKPEIYRTKINIPKFNQCLLSNSSILPPLSATCILNDFNILLWIKQNFISIPLENSTNSMNSINSVIVWSLKQDFNFAIEILSKKIKLYGSLEFTRLFLESLSSDYPTLDTEFLKLKDESMTSLLLKSKNAQSSHQWENLLTLNSQIYRTLKKELN